MRKHGLKKSDKGYEFVPARLVEGTQKWYIEFWVWDVQKGELVRKRAGLAAGRGKSDREKRAIGRNRVMEINEMLQSGFVVDLSEEAAPKGKEGLSEGPALSVIAGIERAVQIKVAKSGLYGKRNYQSFLLVFGEWLRTEGLAQLPLNGLEKSHVYAFVDYLREEREVGAKTVINYVTRLNSLCNELMERGLLLANPTKGVKKPKAVSGTHHVYTEGQRATMEAWMREHDPELYLFTRLVYYAFLRPVEICRMRVRHINLERRSIVIPAELTKNHTQQGVYLVDPLLEALQAAEIHKLAPDMYLFSQKLFPGKVEIARKIATLRHRRALEATDLYDGKLTLYSWKHTGVCNAYQAGVDIKTLQSLLRHSSLDMTAIYMRALGLEVGENLKGKSW